MQAAEIAQTADAIVVGSAIIEKIYESYNKNKNNIGFIVGETCAFVKSLSNSINNKINKENLMSWLSNFVRPKLRAPYKKS